MCGMPIPDGNELCIDCFEMENKKDKVIVDKEHPLVKQDYSSTCNMDDDDENNPCWQCKHFCFPIGCMKDEEELCKIMEAEYEQNKQR